MIREMLWQPLQLVVQPRQLLHQPQPAFRQQSQPQTAHQTDRDMQRGAFQPFQRRCHRTRAPTPDGPRGHALPAQPEVPHQQRQKTSHAMADGLGLHQLVLVRQHQ